MGLQNLKRAKQQQLRALSDNQGATMEPVHPRYVCSICAKEWNGHALCNAHCPQCRNRLPDRHAWSQEAGGKGNDRASNIGFNNDRGK